MVWQLCPIRHSKVKLSRWQWVLISDWDKPETANFVKWQLLPIDVLSFQVALTLKAYLWMFPGWSLQQWSLILNSWSHAKHLMMWRRGYNSLGALMAAAGLLFIRRVSIISLTPESKLHSFICTLTHLKWTRYTNSYIFLLSPGWGPSFLPLIATLYRLSLAKAIVDNCSMTIVLIHVKHFIRKIKFNHNQFIFCLKYCNVQKCFHSSRITLRTVFMEGKLC